MGKATIPDDVMLFSSVLYYEKAPVERAISIMKDHFGDAALVTEPTPFTYTPYYHAEMGSPLYRILLSFTRFVPRDSMPEIKTCTNEIEYDFMEKGQRTINLDPGLITLENVCLATTKPYSHRIYLGKGIWAEVTLIYRGNSFQKLDWTYPDYASDELIRIFNRLRETYKRRHRCQGA